MAIFENLLGKSGSDKPNEDLSSQERNLGGNSNVIVQLGQQELTSLAQYLGNVITQTLSSQANQNSSNKQGEQDNFERYVRYYLDQLFKGIVTEDKATGQKHFALSRLLNRQEMESAVLSSIEDKINNLIELQNATISEQNAIIKKQHDSIGRLENDVIYKTQKDLIMEMIGIADQIKYTLSDQEIERNYDLLLESVQQLGKWVDSSLQTVAVRKKLSDDYTVLDRKTQEIIETEETSNPQENGCYKSILPGYVWAIPMTGCSLINKRSSEVEMYQFVIRPEQVARLKYIKTDNVTSSNSQTEEQFSVSTVELDNDAADESQAYRSEDK